MTKKTIAGETLAEPLNRKENSMLPKSVLIETFRSGTIASLVIVPLAPLFKSMGLRFGHYGPKFAALFIDNPQPWMLFVQHLIIGWVSALPLLLILRGTKAGRWPLLVGAAYGATYYVAVNSIALPMYFNDPTPWQIGWSTIFPSLIGHIIFGVSIALTSQYFMSSGGTKYLPH
ncbi:MAG: DUF1440 domain-containing protein [Herminiimonas sp.]|nr:DUF1440 domain-containing protein [Herminiimonas sp.]